MALEDNLRETRARISQARTKQARAQADYDNAKTRHDLAKKTLKDEFGVETIDEAKAKLAEMKATLDKVTVEIDQQLSEAGA